ncbi:MAG: hypothetical protein ACXWIU_03425, partial [Limisphaerales bacterium]
MARVDEIVSAQFLAWEERGRGWAVHPFPVSPEPPFRPFTEYRLPEIEDDGRKETFLSSLFGSVRSAFVTDPPKQIEEDEPEPEATPFARGSIAELQILLPGDLKISSAHLSALLNGADACREPLAFEIIGRQDGVIAQFAGHPKDIEGTHRRLGALFPNAVFLVAEGRLENAWEKSASFTTAVDFGLEDEFILPLTSDHAVDPFIGIVSALSDLKADELGLFQVIFEPSHYPWSTSALNAITNAEGKTLFLDFGRFLTGSKEKFSSPLFAAVVRVASAAGDTDRAWEI